MSHNPTVSYETDNSTRSSINKSPQWVEKTLSKYFALASVRDFQLERARQVIQGQDVLLITATGSGKTVVLLAGAAAACELGENAICVYIAPTKALVEQQALSTPTALDAFAINEDTLRCAEAEGRDLFRELQARKGTRVVFMTPQMFLGARFRGLLKDANFKRAIKFVSIDEAHLVDDLQTGPFFKTYNLISPMRDVLDPDAVWALATGSLTVAQEALVAHKLTLKPGKYVRARYPVDRPNIMYDIRFLQYPSSNRQHLDLSFLIPPLMHSASEVEPTIVFFSTFAQGQSAMRALDYLIPPNVPNREKIVKLYGSIFSPDYKAAALRDLVDPSSPLRILIATDAVTFGMNVHGIPRVVLADTTSGSFNTLMQQLGRIRGDLAARAIILAPQWTKIIPDEEVKTKQQQEDRARRAKLPPDLLRFLNAGRTDGYQDKDSDIVCPRALNCKLNNEPFIERPRCCNVHVDDPEMDTLLARERADMENWDRILNAPRDPSGEDLRSDNTYRSLSRHPAMQRSLAFVLNRWGVQYFVKHIRTEAMAHLPPTSVLPSSLFDALPDRAHLCTTLERFRRVVNSIMPQGWPDFDKYAPPLLKILQEAMAGYTAIIKESTEKASIKLTKMRLDILVHLCREHNIDTTGLKLKAEFMDVLVEFFVKNELDEPTPEELTQLRAKLDMVKEADKVAKTKERPRQMDQDSNCIEGVGDLAPTPGPALPQASRDDTARSPLVPKKRPASSRPKPRPVKARKLVTAVGDKENNDARFIVSRSGEM
ncbi:P-loop containing nucleoside triphosphate hydrolase protein [Schizophyllum commune H4-8]|uniref:P-loop containing nucleoside triphosphate hydrolase protein n=1 Tax=Schizophyllum commune (strain H4-8 / FGSC 9210) TaxID=578458 RepID=UPI00215DDB98|nr:P-loop containing nucleoside triphosphate hydrolase protein [Schizophyllum commune H4-8]KAI5890741.1 P-loop containing nucleoside triphosphate hydrolase protein [Schizophyllum commune H4-8]